MMYHMKNIITYNDEDIVLPKCMYHIKNLNDALAIDDSDINIHDQVNKFHKAPSTKMAQLEQRQNDLLKKLDVLYEKIKSISVQCSLNNIEKNRPAKQFNYKVSNLEEAVIVFGPDNLPWFFNILKNIIPAVFTWHIHSSVSNEKVAKIKAFTKTFETNNHKTKINFRLIFKNVSAESELKLTSLDVPILGTVNILRYLAYVYPNIIPYDPEDYYMDGLLDLCHILERSAEKNRESIVRKIFANYNEWIYQNQFSIVDLAAYNVVKQWQNYSKYVPKAWIDKCENVDPSRK